jgi:hypothetical protein
MKKYCIGFCFASFLIFSTSVRADDSIKNWAVESALQFHSMASSGAIMFGPALFYGTSGSHHVGIKTLLSVGSTGAYQATLAYRYSPGHEKTRIFGEVAVSYNLINYATEVGSGGSAIGVLHRLTEDLSIGGNAGFEFFGTNGPVSGFMKIGDSIRFTPKASLIVSIDF